MNVENFPDQDEATHGGFSATLTPRLMHSLNRIKNCFEGIFSPALILAILASSRLQGDDYDFWVKRDSGTTRHLFASAANADIVVAVGEQGMILNSIDGLVWRAQSLTSNAFYGVNLLVYPHPNQTFGQQKTNFLAVGQRGTFATSNNGVQWQIGDFGIDIPFYGTAAAGHLAAVGHKTILLSANGLTWGVEFSTDLLYGVGVVPSQGLAVVGSNGLVWIKGGDEAWRTTLLPTAKTLTSVASVNDFAVAVGDDGALFRGVISSGKLEWTPGPDFPGIHFKNVAVANGYFFAVGSDRSTAEDFKFGSGLPSKGVLMTSPDGLRWTKRDVGEVHGLYSISPFKGSLFAFGEDGTVLQNSSTNGGPAVPLDAWAPRLSKTTNALSAVAFGNSTFVAVGASATILTSPDSAAWVRQNAPISGDITCVRFLDGNFVALGDPFLISPDGINWRQAAGDGPGDPFAGYFSDVTRGPEGYLAVGSGDNFAARIATSTDGTKWRGDFGPGRIQVWGGGVAHGNGIYLATGMAGALPTVVASSDLQTWSAEVFDVRSLPRFGPGYFLLLGLFADDHRIGITRDGKTFENLAVTFSNIKDAIFGADTWVAVGPGGSIISSPNAHDWNPRRSGTTLNLNGVAYGMGSFVAVGDNGLILQSGAIKQ